MTVEFISALLGIPASIIGIWMFLREILLSPVDAGERSRPKRVARRVSFLALSILGICAIATAIAFAAFSKHKVNPALRDLVETANRYDSVATGEKLNASLDPFFQIRLPAHMLDSDAIAMWTERVEHSYKQLGGAGQLGVTDLLAITFFSEDSRSIDAVVVEFAGEIRENPNGAPNTFDHKGMRIPYSDTEEATTDFARNWTKHLIPLIEAQRPSASPKSHNQTVNASGYIFADSSVKLLERYSVIRRGS